MEQLTNSALNKIKTEILKRIQQVEMEHNVKVIYAIESGSRSWGFASPNSDYDVRFVYVHPEDWYLNINIESQRDVIEYEIVDEIDLTGWDIRKALKLFAKSNPAIVEWLHSPIIYKDDGIFAMRARELLKINYSVDKGIYHYRSMAKTNYRGYLKSHTVPLKKYFYVLRPLLSIMWLQKYQTPAPIEFDKLIRLIKNNKILSREIAELLEKKKASKEKATGAAIPVINNFIDSELIRLENYKPLMSEKGIEYNKLNKLFKDELAQFVVTEKT